VIPYGRHSTNFRDAFQVAFQVRFRSLTQGAKIEELERLFAKKVGAKYAVAVSSATAGLHLSVLSLNLPKNSSVATSPISFVASSNAIMYAGFNSTFVDIDPSSANMDASSLKVSIGLDSNIKAVIPVHYSGFPCDMKSIYETCQANEISVIEDAAHALGAHYESGESVGSCKYSDLTVFSLHPVKSITAGEGGVITTNNYDLYKKLLRLRSHGINKNDDKFRNSVLSVTDGKANLWYYEMQELGFHYRMTEIQAVLAISQLKRLDAFMLKRRKLALRYAKEFKGEKNFNFLTGHDLKLSSNHLFVVEIDFSRVQKSRNQIMVELRELGIVTQVHYMPIPLHPFYSELGYDVEDIPNSLNFYNRALSIPLFYGLSVRRQKFVIKNLRRVIS
jgi:UDP-4-amino-4,6-dideoxy-N-acetyl-beta-L-altrosamine transaminase